MAKKVVLGLDWGTSYIKGVISKHAKDAVEIVDFFSFKSGNPQEVMKQLEEKVKVKFTQCVTNLSGKNVLVRYIQFPPMTDEEIRAALSVEYTKHLPFEENEEVCLDFQHIHYPDVLGEKKVKELPNLIIIGVKKSYIDDFLSGFTNNKFYPDIIDSDVFAAGNVYTYFDLVPAGRACAIINIGYSKTTVNIMIGPYSVFTREFYTGGEQIIESISKKLVCDMQTAQAAKEAFKQEDRKSILDGMIKTASEIVSEIELSFDYFETKFEKPIEEVVLGGGEVLHKEIRDLFAEKLGKRLNESNITDKVRISGELKEKFQNNLPLYMVALGLSLRTD